MNKRSGLTVLFTLMIFFSFAQDASTLRKKEYNLEKSGLAIEGYDPVAYFKSNKAIKGKKDFALVDQGVTYYFSSMDNKEAFKKNPSQYQPEYGGWCAYAMGAQGEKVSVDPETFKLLNGKLYLFYNSFFNNTLKTWNKDEPNLKAKADVNWKKSYHN